MNKINILISIPFMNKINILISILIMCGLLSAVNIIQQTNKIKSLSNRILVLEKQNKMDQQAIADLSKSYVKPVVLATGGAGSRNNRTIVENTNITPAPIIYPAPAMSSYEKNKLKREIERDIHNRKVMGLKR